MLKLNTERGFIMGKVDTVYEQMVYAEATSVLPLIISYAYHKGDWKNRKKMGMGKTL